MTENTMKMPSMQQAFAIARSSLNARNKARQDVQPTKDSESTFYETGNGNPKQLRFIKQLLDANDKNELRAQDEAALYQQALDHFREITKDKGHVGDIDRMARAAAESDGDADRQDAQEPSGCDLNAAPTAEGGIPLGDALKQFEATAEIKKRRPKARKALDLPEDGSAAVTADAAPPAPVDDDVPAAPPADDFEEDIRPAFLRAREEERESGSVH